MKRLLSILALCSVFTLSLFAQDSPEGDFLQLFEEKTGELSIGIFAANTSAAPITITINFQQRQNIKLDVDLPFVAVVPANSENFNVMNITMIKGKDVSFGYGCGMVMGDAITAKHDDDHTYLLPFEKGKEYIVGQGYNGRFSHHGKNAIDFSMNIGTKVCAARAGTVVFVKEDGSKGCTHERCSPDANYIIVLHADGSFGKYVHLDHNGALVKTGQSIAAGEIIANSGNTGWSSGPHLHFEVYVPVPNGYITIPTKFKTKEEKSVYLQETEVYQK